MKQKVIKLLKWVRDILICCKRSTNDCELHINKYIDVLKNHSNNPTIDKVDLWTKYNLLDDEWRKTRFAKDNNGC